MLPPCPCSSPSNERARLLPIFALASLAALAACSGLPLEGPPGRCQSCWNCGGTAALAASLILPASYTAVGLAPACCCPDAVDVLTLMEGTLLPTDPEIALLDALADTFEPGGGADRAGAP